MVLVPAKGFGSSFEMANHFDVPFRGLQEVWTPRRMSVLINWPNHRPTWLILDDPKVKYTWKRRRRVSYFLNSRVMLHEVHGLGVRVHGVGAGPADPRRPSGWKSWVLPKWVYLARDPAVGRHGALAESHDHLIACGAVGGDEVDAALVWVRTTA